MPFDPGPAAWNELLPAAQHHRELDESLTVDVVVIGAGFAGLSAARRLKQLDPSVSVALVDARRVAQGPAGRNSGFMIDLPHHLASSDYAGQQTADREQTRMNREAIDFARNVVESFDLEDEAFSLTGKINAAATEKGDLHNRAYANHLSDMGEDFRLLDGQQMKEICGSSYYRSGLFTPGTAMLQPALYIRGLADGLARQDGVNIFENSPVLTVTRKQNGVEITTEKGKVSAGAAVLAVNGHVQSFGYFPSRLMHIYLYASMTRQLTDDEVAGLGGTDNWGFTPADPMGSTVRRISGTWGTRLIIRNRFSWAPGRTIGEQVLKPVARTHDATFAARFPGLSHVSMEYRWGGLLCLSLNTVPAFGKLEAGIFSACCQNGLGTAMGTLSGKLCAELILGHTSRSLDHMLSFPEPRRLPPEPFASIGANARMRWGEWRAGREL